MASPSGKVHEEVYSNKAYTIQIFTDGSKNNRKVRAVAVMYEKENLVCKIMSKL